MSKTLGRFHASFLCLSLSVASLSKPLMRLKIAQPCKKKKKIRNATLYSCHKGYSLLTHQLFQVYSVKHTSF